MEQRKCLWAGQDSEAALQTTFERTQRLFDTWTSGACCPAPKNQRATTRKSIPDVRQHPWPTQLAEHSKAGVKYLLSAVEQEGENLYVHKQTAMSPLPKFSLRIMFWSMSQQSLCESKLATFPWKLLNWLREVLFWSEIFKCAVLRVSSQSWRSSGNSWAMNPFCSNPVSEWREDDDKHSNLNRSCPAFALAFSSMALECWLMRHQHCIVSIYPSMDVFWRQLTAWDGQ